MRAAYLGEGDEAEEVPEEQQALLAEVTALQSEVRAETESTNVDGDGHVGGEPLPTSRPRRVSPPPARPSSSST